ERDAKTMEVHSRDGATSTGHMALGFGKQGVNMAVGLGSMIAHPVDTAKGLWFAVKNPDKAIPAMLVSIDECYHDDEDEFAGRVVFELALVAATAGGGEGPDAADKARRFAQAADEAAKAGNTARALRYAQAAEKVAVKAERAAAKVGNVGE